MGHLITILHKGKYHYVKVNQNRCYNWNTNIWTYLYSDDKYHYFSVKSCKYDKSKDRIIKKPISRL